MEETTEEAPKKERMEKRPKKRLLWVGSKNREDTSPFEYNGVSFIPRTVYPVTDAVFDVFRNFHNFVTIDSVKETLIHFPGSYI